MRLLEPVRKSCVQIGQADTMVILKILMTIIMLKFVQISQEDLKKYFNTGENGLHISNALRYTERDAQRHKIQEQRPHLLTIVRNNDSVYGARTRTIKSGVTT